MRQSRGSAPLWVPRPPRACRRCPRRAYGDIASAGAEAGGQVLAAAGPTFAPVGRLSRLRMAVAMGCGKQELLDVFIIETGPWWLGKGFPVAMVVEKVGFLRRGYGTGRAARRTNFRWSGITVFKIQINTHIVSLYIFIF